MGKKLIYFCDKCGEEFTNVSKYNEHVEHCGIKKQFKCMKCGKIIEYTTEDEDSPEYDLSYNECWEFEPNHLRGGYGSRFCNREFNLKICDDCLMELVETFTEEAQKEILGDEDSLLELCYKEDKNSELN